MSPIVYSALVLVHILSMAVWFGGGFSLAGDVRKTLARGKPHTELLGARMSRVLSLAQISAVATIASGFGLFFARGGFKSMPPRYHASIALSLVALGLVFFGLKPATMQVERALAAGEGKDLRSLTKRIGMLTGVDHLLKLIIIVLMVFSFETL